MTHSYILLGLASLLILSAFVYAVRKSNFKLFKTEFDHDDN